MSVSQHSPADLTVLSLDLEKQNMILPESLANAKVSARQQCAYEGPWRRKLRQINAMNTMLTRKPSYR